MPGAGSGSGANPSCGHPDGVTQQHLHRLPSSGLSCEAKRRLSEPCFGCLWGGHPPRHVCRSPGSRPREATLPQSPQVRGGHNILRL